MPDRVDGSVQNLEKDDLKKALADLVREEPETLVSAVAAALGVKPQDFDDIIKTGDKDRERRFVRKLLEDVRNESAKILAVDRDAIEAQRRTIIAPLESALTEKSSRHGGVIARVEAIVAEIEAGRPAEIPKFDDLLKELEA